MAGKVDASRDGSLRQMELDGLVGGVTFLPEEFPFEGGDDGVAQVRLRGPEHFCFKGRYWEGGGSVGASVSVGGRGEE